VDISNAVASLMSTKEEQEISILRKASQVTVEVYQKYLRDQIMDIIDSDRVRSVNLFSISFEHYIIIWYHFVIVNAES
jgi:nucleosome binding factor SPN SPT16 subunit